MLLWNSIQNQGFREYMEDHFIVVPKFYRDYDLAAVFDGHGGEYVSEYCATNLASVLLRCLQRNNGNIRKSLTDCFEELDNSLDPIKSRSTGSTCLVVLCDGNETLWIANSGDSRAIMDKKSNHGCVILSKDHKPDVPDERKRIEDNGGFILHLGVWRVIGELAVSRSIGDKKYRPLVIPTPEVKRVRLIPGENTMIILATDGLWDVVKNKHVIQTAANATQKGASCCDALMSQAMTSGMEDNTTIIVGTISNS
jgi:protein phosphatase 1L